MDPAATATAATRYAALKRLYEALQEDHVDLARRYTAVKQQVAHVSRENEFLVDELCRFTESDFDSDSDDGRTTKQTGFTNGGVKVEKVEAIDAAFTHTRPSAAVNPAVKIESANVDTT